MRFPNLGKVTQPGYYRHYLKIALRLHCFVAIVIHALLGKIWKWKIRPGKISDIFHVCSQHCFRKNMNILSQSNVIPYSLKRRHDKWGLVGVSDGMVWWWPWPVPDRRAISSLSTPPPWPSPWLSPTIPPMSHQLLQSVWPKRLEIVIVCFLLQGGPFNWLHQNLAKSKMIHDTWYTKLF